MNIRMHYLLALVFPLFTLASCGGDDDENDAPATTTITATPESIDASSAGGTYDVSVTTTGKEWGASASADWLSVSTSGSNTSQGQLTVTAQPNTGTATRTAEVVVRSGTARKSISVSQQAALGVSRNSVRTSSKGETVEIAVVGPDDWTATASDAWISTAKNGQTLTITTTQNTSTSERSGRVTVKAGAETADIEVMQNGADDATINAPEGYVLVWHDEFDEGTELNSRDWTHEVQNSGWVNHELQNYRNGTADGKRVTELVDGKLHINCFKGSDGKIYSGRVYAKVREGWTYGYIEARINLPSGKGTWPAFWMMPVNFRSWPADGEIDIMEEVGVNPNYVSSSLHANAHVHSNNTQVTHEMYCAGAEGDYHVYAIEWTHENITTYVDGKVQLTYDNRGLGRDDWPYDDPFYVILNLAWGGDWGGWNGVDESKLPVTMKVDYVRVFQKQ